MKEVIEFIWAIAGCIVLSGGVVMWLRIIYWDNKIRKVVNLYKEIGQMVKDQEILNKL